MQIAQKQISYKSILILIGALAIGVIANFNSLLLHLGDSLLGTPEQGALALLHTWWPMFSLSVPDGWSIHSFIGAPYLSNHLLYMPVIQSALFWFLQFIVSPIAAFNLGLLANVIATQGALFVFFRRKGIPLVWAALGATAFVLSPWYHTELDEANIITTSVWVVVVYLLAWDHWRARPSYGRSLIVVVTLYGAVLCGLQNIMWLILIGLPYTLLQRETSDAKQAHETGVFIWLGFSVLCLLYPVPELVRTLQGNEPAYGPALGEPILRSFVGWLLRSGLGIWIMAGLTVLLRPITRQNVVWLGVAGVSLLIGFGLVPDPLGMVEGGLGLTYWPLAERGFFFGPALLASLIYMSVTWQESWLSGRQGLYWKLAAGGVGVLTLISNPALLRPLPAQTLVIPTFYHEIAAEPEDYLLLEYPYGITSVTTGQTLGTDAYLAENTIWHHKRSLSGVAPFYDAHTFEQIRANAFLFPETLADVSLPDAAKALGQEVREGRIGYIVLHPDLLTTEVQTTLATLIDQSQALCPPITRKGLIIYRAQWHPYGCGTP